MQFQSSILIVDDNPENLKVLSNILREDNFNLALALNGKSALDVLKETEIDLILMDIMMPELTGLETCKILKADPKFKEIPVIFISALNDISDILAAFKVGGVDYITKPFNSEEVKSRIVTQLQIQHQNKELKKLNTDKDRFISILSHDLKNPISGIISYLEIIQEDLNENTLDEIPKMLDIVLKYANSVYTLLDEMLLWYKTQAGNLEISKQEIKLKKAFYEVKQRLSIMALKKQINIEIIEEKDATVIFDLNMLNTILSNLITNAIKFTNRNGKVKISATVNENNTVISITDNGIGISEDSQKKLFDITQIYTTHGTENERGTGLGLLLCKEFIVKHGGNIWVESTPGNGSTFNFSIPH